MLNLTLARGGELRPETLYFGKTLYFYSMLEPPEIGGSSFSIE